MKISQKTELSQNKYFVKMLAKKVIDQDNIDEKVHVGEKLITVQEYHRILAENPEILNDVCDGSKVIDTYLYEFKDSPLEIYAYFDEADNVIYNAMKFKEGQRQPTLLFGKLVSEKYERKYEY
jgi:hypothetical protein